MIRSQLFATYSVVAADADEIGAAVQTHQMCVGSIVPWIEPGIGAVVTQSLVNISLGPLGLELLRQGVSPSHVVAALEASDREALRRQFAAINADGTAAAFTGEGCIPHASHQTGRGYSVQANMMLNDSVVPAMADALESNHGCLADRLIAALRAAEEEAGDIRGMQSAALVTVGNDSSLRFWERTMDLRVDESDDPLAELERLVRLRTAQLKSDTADHLLASGNVQSALKGWSEARALAPELEELGFWQAVELAENHPERAEDAARILKSILDGEQEPERWLALIDRLVECGLMHRPDLRSEIEQFM